MILEKLKVGNRVDRRILQEVNQSYDSENKPEVYKSQIYDLISEYEIILTMPIISSKIILLPVDVRYELCFYTEYGLYTCDAIIKERYKESNIYVVKLEIISALTKFQRREYYRYECLTNLFFQIITDEEELRMFDPVELEEHHRMTFPKDRATSGMIVDISGGGLRAVTTERVKENARVLLLFELEVKGEIKEMLVIGNIISCRKSEKSFDNKYELRIEFANISYKDRELIIRYIFEAERRKKNNNS